MKFLVLLFVTVLWSQGSLGEQCTDGKIRGVNLGGWLLLEPWITPGIFEEVNVGELQGKIADEWTYAEFVDKTFAKERLTKHWDEFYQRGDLEALYQSGISHLRVPVGYWLVDVAEGEPFPAPPETDNDGQRFYLKRLLQWADEIGLKILLDLHGAPGSQNGFDNSGRRGDVHWLENGNVDRTIEILGKLSDLLEVWILEGAIKAETLYGIELLNEPRGWEDPIWTTCRDNFYPNGYAKVRSFFTGIEESKRPWVTIQSAFRATSDFHGYMPEPDFQSVSLDTHNYQCFGGYWNGLAEKPEGWGAHLDASCNYHTEVAALTLPTFNGEFSLAVTDCQKYLNGGIAFPYNPEASDAACKYYNSDFTTFVPEYKEFLKKYFIAQIDAFEYGATGAGWFFWTAKTENNCAPEWDYLFLLQNGIVPQNLCKRDVFCIFKKQ